MDKTSPTSAGTGEAACDKEQHAMSMDRAIGLIGDRWTLFIVYNLLSGPKRFGELLTMGNVSPKTVSQRLKMLEKIGFVERHAFAEIPPRVEYHLTEKGQALVDILQAISQFGERYLADDEISPDAPPPPLCH
jgi:DNA-binding HxlR family transcriptional regulator